MPMTRYRRGYECERLCIRDLERLGSEAVRTAGSHGPFDVVAWNGRGYQLIQVRGRRLCPKEREQALEELAAMPSVPQVSRELWERHEGQWLIRMVKGTSAVGG